MKNLKKKQGLLFMSCIFISCLFIACANKSVHTESSKSDQSMDSSVMDSGAMEEEPERELETDSMAGFNINLSDPNPINEVNKALKGYKLIRRVYLSVETREFDTMTTKLMKKVSELGGYIESSEQNGSGYNYSNENRHYNAVIRVPKVKLDEFVSSIGVLANIITKREESEDVTLQYVDIESHKKALIIEQERLLLLLEKTETLKDIIELEKRLSKVRYELQAYESELRTYDNLVDYSTVTIDLYEVDRITQRDEETFLDRIRNGWSNNLYNLSTGLEDFIVWFISSIPYFIIWGILILPVTVIIIKRRKKRKKKDINYLEKGLEEDK